MCVCVGGEERGGFRLLWPYAMIQAPSPNQTGKIIKKKTSDNRELVFVTKNCDCVLCVKERVRGEGGAGIKCTACKKRKKKTTDGMGGGERVRKQHLVREKSRKVFLRENRIDGNIDGDHGELNSKVQGWSWSWSWSESKPDEMFDSSDLVLRIGIDNKGGDTSGGFAIFPLGWESTW